MMWKILIGLDIAFSSLAIIAAGVLGNSLIANHVPRLHDNSTWLSRPSSCIENGFQFKQTALARAFFRHGAPPLKLTPGEIEPSLNDK